MRVPSGFTHLRDELCAEPPPDDRAPRTVSVYDHAGVEFVLVPAAEGVELGWDGGLAGLADRVVESLADDLDRVLHPLEGHRRWLAEIDPDEEPEAAAWLADQVARYEAEGDPEFDDATRARFTLDGFAAMVDEVTSPRRRVDLPAMLVERHPRLVGQRLVGTVDPITGDGDLGEADRDLLDPIRELLRDRGRHTADGITLVGTVSLIRTGPVFQVWRHEQTNHSDLREAVTAGGFALPTEDEWEYLCGGGARTLFRWGNDLPELPYGYGDEAATLQRPNRQGVRIGYDQFTIEALDTWSVGKGGDGGVGMHDGIGMLPMLLPLSTFFRSPSEGPNANLSGGYDVFRRVLRL